MILASFEKNSNLEIEKNCSQAKEQKLISPEQPIKKNKKNNIRSNQLARETAIQAIFQWQMNPIDSEQLIKQFIQQNRLKDITNVTFFKELVLGTIKHYQNISQQLKLLYKKGEYHIVEIDKAILHLAVYELDYATNKIDKPIIVNEAIRIAKIYSPENSYKFINQLLDLLMSKE